MGKTVVERTLRRGNYRSAVCKLYGKIQEKIARFTGQSRAYRQIRLAERNAYRRNVSRRNLLLRRRRKTRFSTLPTKFYLTTFSPNRAILPKLYLTLSIPLFFRYRKSPPLRRRFPFLPQSVSSTAPGQFPYVFFSFRKLFFVLFYRI